MHQSEVLEALLCKIRDEYRDDVSFVVVLGSTIYGDTHEKSDLDLYYLAKTPRGNELSQVFILDGVGYDIWSIPWDRLCRIASHDERITSIITEGRLVYFCSGDDLRKFNELRATALDVNDKAKFLEKAQSALDRAMKSFYLQCAGKDLYEVRMNAIRIVKDVAYAIALLNRETIKRGRGKLKAEILAMPLVPRDFAASYDALFEASKGEDVKRSCDALVRDTQELIDQERARQRGTRTFREGMSFIYEEMINFYNKIRHACETADYVTALYAAAELQGEFEECFSGTGMDARDLPNIIEAYDPRNPEAFLRVVDSHQRAVLGLLRENGVAVTEFSSIEEVRRHISGIGRRQQPS